MTEQRWRDPGGPVRCSQCGHVTPYLRGWMLAAVMHHQVAVHNGSMSWLKRR